MKTLGAALPEHCPDCGGHFVEDHLDHQFHTEIPRKPIVRQFNIHWRARTLVDKQTGAGRLFPQQAIDLLTDALRLRDPLNKENADEVRRGLVYEDYVQRLRDLTKRPRVNKANARFARHLNKHAASWFLFLVDPSIPATNHRAEHALKTPIVNRKVWGGNRTGAGGEAQAVTSSVLQTCQKKAIDVFQFIGNAVRGVIGRLFAPPADAAAK